MCAMAVLLTFIGLLVACDRPPATSDRAESHNAPPPGNLHLEISDGSVSLRTHRVPMGDVFEAIAYEDGFELVLEQPLEDELTVQFQDLPLPEAIDRISSSSRPAEDEVADSIATSQGLDVTTRLAIIVALAEDGSTQAVARLDDALSDPDPTVREEAVHALEAIGGNQTTLVLQQALMDPAPTVRAAVVEAYADIGGEESAHALAVALQDADPAIREAAVWALGEIDNPAATRYLSQALDDNEDAVRDAAAQMLDELSHQAAAAHVPGRESSLAPLR